MSLILEALKKSEAQRRLGEAPSLGTPFTATRRRRSPLPWITLGVVLVAAGAGWWLLRPHARLAETAAATAPANGARAAADAKARIQPAAPASVPAQRPTEAHAPPIAVIAPPTPSPAATPHRAPPVTDEITSIPPNTALSAPPPKRPYPHRLGLLSRRRKRPTRTKPRRATLRARRRRQQRRRLPQPRHPAPAQASPPASAEPAIPTVDELAFDLRRDLPDLPITMQVYSSDPTRRFILVDGERKKEGDAIRDVAVREIRSNGVVLEFRGQRFLLPRPGS